MTKVYLSEHFTLREMFYSQTAIRMGINNTPNDAQVRFARQHCINALEPLRAHFGIPYSPSSWLRVEALEREICKAGYLRYCRTRKLEANETSWKQYFALKDHPSGGCTDIEIPGVPNVVLFEAVQNLCTFDELILEYHDPSDPDSGWVHVSSSPGVNRRIVRKIT